MGDRIVHKSPVGGSPGASSPSEWSTQDAFPPSSQDHQEDVRRQQQEDRQRERSNSAARGRAQGSQVGQAQQQQQTQQYQQPHEDTIVNNNFIKVTRPHPAEIIVIG
jgi:hypothetical protein